MTARKKKEPSPTAKTLPFVSSITLGGFQVFDEPTTIPFGRLTFLFGPNSSGKSSIDDALTLLSTMLSGKSVDHNKPPSWRLKTLLPHWRRTGPELSDLVPLMTIGIELTHPTSLSGVLASMFSWPEKRRTRVLSDHLVKFEFLHRLHWGDLTNPTVEDGFVNRDVYIEYDSIPLIKLIESQQFSLNVAHPVLSAAQWHFSPDRLNDSYPAVLNREGEWLHVKTSNATLNLINKVFDLAPSTGEDDARDSANVPLPAFDLSVAIEQIVSVSNEIYRTLVANATLSPDVVTASRTIPKADDLTHYISSGSDPTTVHGFEPLADFNFAEKRSRYSDLATSFVNLKVEGSDGAWSISADVDLFEKVNHVLSDHLFIDRGYRLDGDYIALIRKDQFEEFPYQTNFYPGSYPLLVRLFLRDDKARQLDFTQVGSGLGYVLPVLCSIMSNRISISLVQQPELHLHPALQAAMGDVLIQAVNAKDDIKQVVAETHSEHILLRVLKRIRQTQSGSSPSGELEIGPDDVSVVYFDPRPDGTTKVQRLRISPDGDFLDLWPRGFFSERDQELFDE
jgi:hypothetical protein